MESAPLEIIRCPRQRIAEALSLVLCDIAPSQRREIAGELLGVDKRADVSHELLFIALRGDELRGAAWGQRQPGNIAVFWPPQLVPGEEGQTGVDLAESIVRLLDQTAVEMTQVLLPTADASAVPTLQSLGFRHLADLLYMSCEAARFPAEPPAVELEFIPYSGSQRRRMMELVEQTYEETLDCVALNGMRTIDDIISGYEGTGVFRPENWLLVRARGQDIGVLLLADHPQARHWELMYMGLVPQWRGYGFGRQIAQHAAWRARRAGVERIVLAVDALNEPALRMYGSVGFEIWDRRTVYARFPASKRA